MANTEKTAIQMLIGNPKNGQKPVMLSFVKVFKPEANLSGKLKYSIMMVINKNDAGTLKAINEAIAELKATAAKMNGGKLPPKFMIPLRDGDDIDENEKDEARRGCYFMNASSDAEKGKKPEVVKKENGMILPANEDDVYSGCFAVVDVQFYIYGMDGKNTTGGNRGIAIGLGNILKAAEGKRLAGGGQSAASAFSDVEIEEEEESYL